MNHKIKLSNKTVIMITIKSFREVRLQLNTLLHLWYLEGIQQKCKVNIKRDL
jgi:hypothetical protein